MFEPLDDFFSAPPVSEPEQFKLTQMQLFNWGTFSDLLVVDVAKKGFLFVGPSGAGKSTILDAHATLTTPRKWVGFNLAAREGDSSGADRNEMTYVRGAWGQQTGASGNTVQQYLRENTTWSALAETYTSQKRIVTIAQVFWVRGSTTDRKDIKRTYLVVDRAFDVQELQPFANKDFEMRLIRALPGVHVHDEFSGYGERFRRIVGIDQESSLRLLHKTQSAKNLGDINDFLRDFTLEPPQTFEKARELVTHFQALRQAHDSVVDARKQVQVLVPARAAYDQWLTHSAQIAALTQDNANLETYRQQVWAQLLQADIAKHTQSIKELEDAQRASAEQATQAASELSLLESKLDGSATARRRECAFNAQLAEQHLQAVAQRQPLLTAACAVLGAEPPTVEADWSELMGQISAYLAAAAQREAENQEKRNVLGVEQRTVATDMTKVQQELVALAKRRSNMPANLLNFREQLCATLGVSEDTLPFAGELVDVRDSALEWKGAAERVMRNFAEHLVVPGPMFAAVKRLVNNRHTGALVKLYNTEVALPMRALSATSLATKLTFTEHPQASWVEAKATALFDHECVANVDDMAYARRALTKEGLVKGDESSFKKDDRTRLDDRRHWILGGDSRAKVASLHEAHEALTKRKQDLERQLALLDSPKDYAEARRACERLEDRTWVELDLCFAQRQQACAQAELALAEADAPDQTQLTAKIKALGELREDVVRTLGRQQEKLTAANRFLTSLRNRLAGIAHDVLAVELPEDVITKLEARFRRYTPAMTLDNLDVLAPKVAIDISNDINAARLELATCAREVENRFREYMRNWPEKARGLDPSTNSAPEFLVILTALEQDGLVQYEHKFLEQLKEQGTQSMAELYTQLEAERKDIRVRMAAVNSSLRKTAFNPGTHLVIEPKEKSLPEVMEFRKSIKEVFSNYLQDSTVADAERRFLVLNDIIQKLERPDAKAWRDLCLDVRRHVDFIIREMTQDEVEVEVYRSGAGKSGGQRQKLTATILAAALRYQLGGKETGVAKFSTVFMDEAFDKADDVFTDLAMKVFETFGFQLVVATPLKSVMTLEPYIGGACFVHIEERKRSRVVQLHYHEEHKKLDFGTLGGALETHEDI